MRVVVIGAGIVGASTAYHLATRYGTRGDLDVVLVDREDAGRATDAGAGIVCPWISPYVDTRSPAYQLNVRGASYYPRLLARLAEAGEPHSGFSAVGAVFVSPDPDEVARAYEHLAARTARTPAAGVATRLQPEEVRRLFPPLRADLGGVHVSGGGRVDGRVLRDVLLRAGSRFGVRRLTRSARLLLDHDRCTGVVVDGPGGGKAIRADAVVVAAGAWSDQILAPTGVRVGVAPQKGQIVHLHAPDTDTSSWPVIQPAGSHYLLAFPGGRIVVGATREDGSGYDVRITAAGLREVLSDALAVAPGLGDLTVLETRVGLRPLSDDGLPVVGRLPHDENVVVATGLGATGLTAGPYVGALAAALALGEDIDVVENDTPHLPPLDLAPFRPGRGG
jgi:D-amino-acid dehydrogenase